jgi:hypothetical protein
MVRISLLRPGDVPVGRVLILCGVIATLICYWPGLSGSFFFDDYPNVINNAGVRILDLSVESLRQAWGGGIAGALGRPVSQLSFSLNYWFSGYDPFAFKLANVVIHCINGVLVFLLADQILDSFEGRVPSAYRTRVAAFIACAWLLHPIQLTSVLYVVQRMASLSALFLLAGVLLHAVARRKRHWSLRLRIFCGLGAWCIFFPLAVLSKESGVLFLGFVAAWELIVFRCENGQLDRCVRWLTWLAAILAAGTVFLLSDVIGGHLIAGYGIRSFSLVERLYTEARVLWEYLAWMAFPSLENFGLFHDDMAVSTGLLQPWTTLPAVLGIIGLGLFSVLGSRRFPLAAFGVAWFLVAHALESTFIPLELVHEHRNYLALFGILMIPAPLLLRLAGRAGVTRTFAVTLMISFVGYFSTITYLRAGMYGNEFNRTQIEAQFRSESARTNYEAGRMLARAVESGQGADVALILAKKHFEKATALDPDYKMGLLGAIVLACGTAGQVDLAAYDELARRFRERLFLQEDTSILMALVDFASAKLVCLDRAQMDGLFQGFAANERTSPTKRGEMHALHADYLWLSLNDNQASQLALKRALVLDPGNSSVHLKLAQLEYIAGDLVAARNRLAEISEVRLSPGERDTLKGLSSALAGGGN